MTNIKIVKLVNGDDIVCAFPSEQLPEDSKLLRISKPFQVKYIPQLTPQGFKDYVKRTYGEIDEDNIREFQRGQEGTQLFGPPPRSEGKAVALGHKDSWYVDLIELRNIFEIHLNI